MILSSLATVALSASAALSPLSNMVHFHPKAPDSRVSVTLVNKANGFRDVKVDGRAYSLPAGQTLRITAPAGTRVYAESPMRSVRRGDLLLEVTPAIDHQAITLN